MTKAAFSLAVLWSLATVVVAQPVQTPQGAWLQDDIKWLKAPKKINPKLRYGRAAIIYFGPDHTFALIYAWVERVQGKYEGISNGDGQVVYMGSWELAEKTVKVKYRLVSRTVQVAGEQLPGPFKEDIARIEGAVVLFLEHSFHRSAALDADVVEYFPHDEH